MAFETGIGKAPDGPVGLPGVPFSKSSGSKTFKPDTNFPRAEPGQFRTTNKSGFTGDVGSAADDHDD